VPLPYFIYYIFYCLALSDTSSYLLTAEVPSDNTDSSLPKIVLLITVGCPHRLH